MSIMEKAKQLGEAIAESQENQNLKNAGMEMYQDNEAKTILDDFSALQKRIQMAQANGKPLTEKQQKEIQNIQVKMQGNESISNFMEAQQHFNQLLQTVNQTISSVIEPENSTED